MSERRESRSVVQDLAEDVSVRDVSSVRKWRELRVLRNSTGMSWRGRWPLRSIKARAKRDERNLRYSSCRLKISSFSRLGQLVHSRQHTNRTATPSVTRMANTLAYEANQ